MELFVMGSSSTFIFIQEESFYGSPPINFFFSEIAGFGNPSSRSCLLQYGVPLETPRRHRSIDLLRTKNSTMEDALFSIVAFLASSSHETFVKERKKKIAGFFWGGAIIEDFVPSIRFFGCGVQLLLLE